MDYDELDRFVTDTLNVIRQEGAERRDQVLSGNLDYEGYKFQSGYLYGLESAATVLIQKAKELYKEET